MRTAIGVITMIIMWIIAKRKGFNPFLWLLAGGIPGLITLVCLPAANTEGLDETMRLMRRSRGDLLGLILSCLGLALLLGLVSMVRSSHPSPWQIVAHLDFAAKIILVAAVWRLFPEIQSPWKMALQWTYGAALIASLMLIVLSLNTPLSLLFIHLWPIQALNTVVYLAASAMLLVMAARNRTLAFSVLTCAGALVATATIVVINTSWPSSVVGWDIGAGILYTIANIITLVAVFQMFPGEQSPWRVALRWLWTLTAIIPFLPTTLGLLPLDLQIEVLRLIQSGKQLPFLGAAVALLVLATPSARGRIVMTAPNQRSNRTLYSAG